MNTLPKRFDFYGFPDIDEEGWAVSCEDVRDWLTYLLNEHDKGNYATVEKLINEFILHLE